MLHVRCMLYYSFVYMLQLCLKYHDYHNLCMYHAALSYASLGKFYESLKLLVSNSKKMITPQPSAVPVLYFVLHILITL